MEGVFRLVTSGPDNDVWIHVQFLTVFDANNTLHVDIVKAEVECR